MDTQKTMWIAKGNTLTFCKIDFGQKEPWNVV